MGLSFFLSFIGVLYKILNLDIFKCDVLSVPPRHLHTLALFEGRDIQCSFSDLCSHL